MGRAILSRHDASFGIGPQPISSNAPKLLIPSFLRKQESSGLSPEATKRRWIPAFAGMTVRGMGRVILGRHDASFGIGPQAISSIAPKYLGPDIPPKAGNQCLTA